MNKLRDYKRDCHELLEKMWGSDNRGKTLGYAWLEKEFGRNLHFGDLGPDDLPLLGKVYARLLARSVLEDNKNLLDSKFGSMRKEDRQYKWSLARNKLQRPKFHRGKRRAAHA